jgi:chromosomal replication initiator protein
VELNADLWGQIKDRIKNRNKDNKLVETWIEPIKFLETVQNQQSSKMILGVPSSLHQYFVVENLLDKIYGEISDIYRKDFEVDIVVSQLKNLISNDPQISFEQTIDLRPSQPVVQQQAMPSYQVIKNAKELNSDYTFSTFVVGKNTEFAHAASFNVAQNPGSEGYNPLFICGPVGMGKTHLLHAVGNHIKSNFPHLRINYILAADFLNECVSAIRRHEMDKFRSRYRENSDILLVDDVQYIGRGEATQEEFFHTLNSFFEHKKQVVVASDRMPKDINGLEDRSRSRLEWGLIADISMPDIETRLAILRYKSEKVGLKLPDEVAHYIARISKRSIRELEGNIKKVKMFSELQGLTIDIELTRRVLAHHDTQTTISLEDIQKLVSDHFKIRVMDLKSTARAKQIVVPRQIAMYLIKRHLDKSLVDIGKAFGGKDHTTVMNAIERVEHLQAKDLSIKNDIEELVTRIHNITGV